MNETTDLAAYYAARAAEYERVYAKPERQTDLSRLRAAVAEFARGRRVLEVACGTGYHVRRWYVFPPSSAYAIGVLLPST